MKGQSRGLDLGWSRTTILEHPGRWQVGSLEDLKYNVHERNQWVVTRQSSGHLVQLMKGTMWLTRGAYPKDPRSKRLNGVRRLLVGRSVNQSSATRKEL